MMLDYSGGMMSGFYGGGGWLWMAATMVVGVGVIIGLTVFLIRALNGPMRNDQDEKTRKALRD